MINSLRAAGLLWPSLFVIVALPVLIALGNWQWNRMHWKQGLLQRLEAAAAAKPIRMRVVPSNAMITSAKELKALRFRRIAVSGVFEHQHQMHVWAPGPDGAAWSVVTPLRLRLDAAAESRLSRTQATHLLVIRGVVPADKKDPAQRSFGEVTGPTGLTGRIRLDRPNAWANEPNIEKNEWFTRDWKAMTTHIQASKEEPMRMAPFFLEAEHPSHRTAPKPDLKALTLTNRHLEYAMTWWGLAATLAGVFAVYAWGRIKPAKT